MILLFRFVILLKLEEREIFIFSFSLIQIDFLESRETWCSKSIIQIQCQTLEK